MGKNTTEELAAKNTLPEAAKKVDLRLRVITAFSSMTDV